MTQNSDRSSNDLETIKEILLATARRAEATDGRLAESGRAIDARLDRLTENQERTQEQLNELRENLQALRVDVDIAFETIKLSSENADRERSEFRAEIQQRYIDADRDRVNFRSEMRQMSENADRDRAEFRAEVRQIWEYLMRRYQDNGNGGQDQTG